MMTVNEKAKDKEMTNKQQNVKKLTAKLREHNDWRRGKPTREMKPKDIGILIDDVIDALNDYAVLIGEKTGEPSELGTVTNNAISMEEILNEAQRREAKHSVQYCDYSPDTWTVANDLLEHRKKALLADGSVRKVRIEYEM